MPQRQTPDPSLTWPNAAIRRLLVTQPPEACNVAGVILCAGTGTRMVPLTHTLPKPLLPALNCPLLIWNIAHLSGRTRNIHLNTHHLSGAFEPIRTIAHSVGVAVTLAVEAQLSGPFGGVLACFRHETRPRDIIVLAGDGLYDVDFAKLLAFHREREADLTIGVTAVANGSRYGVLSLDDRHRVCAMHEKPANVGAVESASCGVYVLAGRLVERFVDYIGPLDWVDVVTALLCDKSIVVASRVSRWLDAGVPLDLLDLNLKLLNSEAVCKVADRTDHPTGQVWRQGPERPLRDTKFEGTVLIGEGVKFEVDTDVANAVLGTGSVLGRGAVVRNSVIMPGAVVPAGMIVNETVWS